MATAAPSDRILVPLDSNLGGWNGDSNAVIPSVAEIRREMTRLLSDETRDFIVAETALLRSGRGAAGLDIKADRHARRELGMVFDGVTITPAPGGHLYSRSPLITRESDLGMPIGAYGEGHTRALMTGTIQVLSDWQDWVREDAARRGPRLDTNSPMAEIIRMATFQKNPAQIVGEGLQSIGQALALLTVDAPAPYQRDPMGLLRAIVRGDAVQQLARLLPFSVLAPTSDRGYRFPGPLLSFSTDGAAHLSAQLVAALRPAWQTYVKAEKARRTTDNVDQAKHGKAAAGIGCLVAHGPPDETLIHALMEPVVMASDVARRQLRAERPLWRRAVGQISREIQ